MDWVAAEGQDVDLRDCVVLLGLEQLRGMVCGLEDGTDSTLTYTALIPRPLLQISSQGVASTPKYAHG